MPIASHLCRWLAAKRRKRSAATSCLVSLAGSAKRPITLGDSEPEPDVMMVRGDTRQYRDRHPGAEDVALVVEVADSTIERDRGIKKEMYARAGIPVYWIINLVERLIEVYEEPVGSDYTSRRDYPADSVPVIVEGREVGRILVSALLP